MKVDSQYQLGVLGHFHFDMCDSFCHTALAGAVLVMCVWICPQKALAHGHTVSTSLETPEDWEGLKDSVDLECQPGLWQTWQFRVSRFQAAKLQGPKSKTFRNEV